MNNRIRTGLQRNTTGALQTEDTNTVTSIHSRYSIAIFARNRERHRSRFSGPEMVLPCVNSILQEDRFYLGQIVCTVVGEESVRTGSTVITFRHTHLEEARSTFYYIGGIGRSGSLNARIVILIRRIHRLERGGRDRCAVQQEMGYILLLCNQVNAHAHSAGEGLITGYIRTGTMYLRYDRSAKLSA